MTLRPIFLLFTALSFLGALLLWNSEPPRPATIFGSEKIVELKGIAEQYTAPKGTKRIQIKTATGSTYFTDCLAIVQVCSAAPGERFPVVIQAVFTSRLVFWPISVSSQGAALVNAESSAQAYEIFVEQEASLYRLPLLLGIAFLVFSFWFGGRPALP